MKLQRNYQIIIKTPFGDQYVITPPISVQMSITRNVMASTNNTTLTIYNLSPNTRNGLYKDKFIMKPYWEMVIRAGYGNQLFEIFRGNIQEAYSFKDGNRPTEWQTVINAYDGTWQIQNGFINETVSKGTTLSDGVKRIVGSIPNMLLGYLGSPIQGKTMTRGQTFVGNPYDALQQISGNQAYIDKGAVNILGPNDVIGTDIFVLSSDNIYGSPQRRDTYLEVPAIFSPEIEVGQLCQLDSEITRFRGQYKVMGIRHDALISEAIVGEAITTIDLFAGSAPFLTENQVAAF